MLHVFEYMVEFVMFTDVTWVCTVTFDCSYAGINADDYCFIGNFSTRVTLFGEFISFFVLSMD